MSNTSIKGKLKMNRDIRQNIIAILVLAVTLAFFGIKSPYFLTVNNIITLFAAAVPLGLIGIAESCCLLTGAFDMSVGMVASLSGVICSMLTAYHGFNCYASFGISLIFGIVSGLLAGLSIAFLKMPPWIATYALMQIWRGVIYILTEGAAVRLTTFKEFKVLGQYKLFGTTITPAILIMLLCYILFYILLKYTKLGRDLFIVGGNREAAKNVGIRIHNRVIFAFVVSGFMSALAGVLFASRAGSGQPIIGDMYAMQAIAGAVVGGTSMAGGKTNPIMTLAGIMLVVSIQNGLNMISVPAYYQHIVTGLLLVLSILVQTERKK